MLTLLFVVIIAAVVLAMARPNRAARSGGGFDAPQLDDAIAEARHWIERLGGQVLSLTGTDSASTQALADASERYNSASSQISTAKTPKQALLAREAALEGLYYVQAARELMGLPAGPALPPLQGQQQAGQVTEQRTITHEGQTITASPTANPYATHYYPGGLVAGRPVPAGWYSQPWWVPALTTGVWAASSAMLFSAMFGGMHGIGFNPFGIGDDHFSGPGIFDENPGGFDGIGDGDFGGGDFGGGDFGGFDF